MNPGQPTLSHQTVVIEDGMIAEIRPADRKARRNIARYLLPGLIDTHVHLPRFQPDEELFHTLYLMHGVTTVRYMGDAGRYLELAQAIGKGERIGLRTMGCGTLLDGPQGSNIAIELETAEEAEEAVHALYEDGASCIKVYSHASSGSFSSGAQKAEELKLPVVGRMNNRLGIGRNQDGRGSSSARRT